MAPERKLCVLAGAGMLPRLVIEASRQAGLPVMAVAFPRHTDPATVTEVPHFWTRIGKAGSVLRRLKAEGVTDLVMAGAIRRPGLAELRPDWYTARFFARLGRKALGDDGLLRAVAKTLEGEGFRVVGAHEIVRNLLAPAGQIGSIPLSLQHTMDIRRGIGVARALGEADIGQGVVVQQGIVLGLEAAEGTDRLIERCGQMACQGSRPVLVKFAKPGQDERVDLPTVGEQTLRAAASAGFAGIAVEAGRTILLDTARLAAEADRLGLFLTSVAADAA